MTDVFIHQLQAVVMAISFKFSMIINIFGVHIARSISKNTFLLFVIFSINQKSQRTGKTGLRLPVDVFSRWGFA